MVLMVSANTYQIAHSHVLGAGSIGMAISVVWFLNARKAAHSELSGACWVYGLGAGLGTMTGMKVAMALWGGQ